MSYIAQLQGKIVALRLYVQPKASNTKLIGLYDGCLKLAVASPPVDGKANKEIQKFLAKIFSVAKSDIVIKSGAHSRRKTVVVKNRSVSEIRATLARLLGGLQ